MNCSNKRSVTGQLSFFISILQLLLLLLLLGGVLGAASCGDEESGKENNKISADAGPDGCGCDE